MSIPSLSLSEVARAIGGIVLRDAAFSNLGFAIHAGPGLLSWLEHKNYLGAILKNKGISAVIAPKDLADLIPEGTGILLHEQPREAFYNLHNHLARMTNFYGKHVPSEIHSAATLEPGSFIAPAGVRIAENVLIESGARILPGTRIGAGSIIRAGVVVGSPGLQYAKMAGKWVSIDHVGGVEIGKDVEIKEYSIIGRAIFRGDTTIGDNCKLDAYVFIGHHAHMGKRILCCGGAGIGGHSVIGDDVFVGGKAMIVNCIEVGAGARITMGSVVVSSVKPQTHVTGNWAIPHNKFLTAYGRFLASAGKNNS
jgi:UDP-3-O-[3-hydroxymyristoyl] glucosamine N-acyltransferase